MNKRDFNERVHQDWKDELGHNDEINDRELYEQKIFDGSKREADTDQSRRKERSEQKSS